MKSTIYLSVLLCCSIIFGFVGVAKACSCGRSPIEKRFETEAFIAVGRIVKTEDIDEGQNGGRVTLKLSKIYKGSEYKGKLDETITLKMPGAIHGSAGCAYDFRLGATYLVFARDLSEIYPNTLNTSLCSQNRDAHYERDEYSNEVNWLDQKTAGSEK